MAWVISIVLFCITSVCAGFYTENSRNIQNASLRFVKKIYDTFRCCVILIFSHRMSYAGWDKKAKSHFENCSYGPEETPVQGDCSYILTECKKNAKRHLVIIKDSWGVKKSKCRPKMQHSNPRSQTPIRQQTECLLTNRLSYRGSS